MKSCECGRTLTYAVTKVQGVQEVHEVCPQCDLGVSREKILELYEKWMYDTYNMPYKTLRFPNDTPNFKIIPARMTGKTAILKTLQGALERQEVKIRVTETTQYGEL